jgi:5-methylcytosine-specific restriction endonuclease McrA
MTAPDTPGTPVCADPRLRTIICAHCSDQVERHYAAKYCSNKCKIASYHQRHRDKLLLGMRQYYQDNRERIRETERIKCAAAATTIDCGYCGKTVRLLGSRKYCSSSCRDKARYRQPARQASMKEYRQRNRARINSINRARCAAPEVKNRLAAQRRKGYEKHRVRRIADAVEYQRTHPHVVRSTRLRREGVPTLQITAQDLSRLLTQYRHQCAYCGTKLSPHGRDLPSSLQWDHVVPLRRGGRHSIGNLVPACRTCNISKSAKLLVEYRVRIRTLSDTVASLDGLATAALGGAVWDGGEDQ